MFTGQSAHLSFELGQISCNVVVVGGSPGMQKLFYLPEANLNFPEGKLLPPFHIYFFIWKSRIFLQKLKFARKELPKYHVFFRHGIRHTSFTTSLLPSQHWIKPVAIYTPGWRGLIKVYSFTKVHTTWWSQWNSNPQPIDNGMSEVFTGPRVYISN